MNWYVVKTKANKEILAKQNLKNQNFEVYLPCIKKVVKLKNKFKIVRKTLFSNYLFVKFNLNTHHWSKINNTRGVAHLVKLSNDLSRVSEEDINTLKLSEDNDNFIVLSKIQKPILGRLYKILDGPFKGHEAKFSGKKDKKNIFLNLELLGRNINLNFPYNLVEPV